MSLQRKISAALLSLFLLFNGTIQHLVHHFEDHQETVHQHCTNHHENNRELSFESKHHHCDYLTSLLPHFIGSTTVFCLSFKEFPQVPVYKNAAITVVTLPKSGSLFLRGPPAQLIA